MEVLAHTKCPGKLLLSGEHSTVYGKNAVAITIDLYTDVNIYYHDDQTVKLVLKNLNFETSWPIEQLKQVSPIVKPGGKFIFSEDLLSLIRHLLPDESADIINSCVTFLLLYISISDVSFYSDRKPMLVEVSSSIPNGAGLGSSASYIVSLSKALFTTYNVRIQMNEFNKWCFETEKLFHGKPSGVDNSICTFGGAVLFRDGAIVERIPNEKLNEISNLKVLLVNTNVPRNTKVMVERCRKRKESFPEVIEHVLDSLGNLTSNVWDALKSNNFHLLSALFDMNQQLLNCLDVGHEKIDTVVNIAKKHSASAKLTGAGGGGFVLLFLPCKADVNEETLVEELEAQQFTCHKVKLGVDGVQTENIF